VFNEANTTYIESTYDSDSQSVIIVYANAGNSDYGTAITFKAQEVTNNLTAENYIGVSDGNYSDTDTATVLIAGSVSDAQTGLTAGQTYYVQNDGTISTTPDDPSVFAGTAISSTKLIVQG
jgi:hypothetical protein